MEFLKAVQQQPPNQCDIHLSNLILFDFTKSTYKYIEIGNFHFTEHTNHTHEYMNTTTTKLIYKYIEIGKKSRLTSLIS